MKPVLAKKDRIAKNLSAIQERIRQAALRADRDPELARLIAVTKTVDQESCQILLDLGQRELGENRLEVAKEKIAALPEDICWHMIGNVQRRKVGGILGLFDTIDAVDRLSLAQRIQQRCEEQDRRIKVLIEVNVSGESVKHGFSPAQIPESLKALQDYDRLLLDGFMTMAPFGAEEEQLRAIFGQLRDLTDAYGFSECSMGMSDDFEIAVEEGATQVRIGRALFQ